MLCAQYEHITTTSISCVCAHEYVRAWMCAQHTHIYTPDHTLRVCVFVSQRARHTLARIKTPSRDSVSVKRSSQKVKSQFNRFVRASHDTRLRHRTTRFTRTRLPRHRVSVRVLRLCVSLAGLLWMVGLCVCRVSVLRGGVSTRSPATVWSTDHASAQRQQRILCI